MLLLLYTIPGIVFTVWFIFYLFIMKNKKQKLLIFFTTCFIPSFLWGFDYLSNNGFIITSAFSLVAGVYFWAKSDE